MSIQYFNQVINVKPYLCEPYFYRGLAKLNLEDYRGAEEDCTRTIECNPFVVNAYNVRALARINLKDYDGAIEDYRAAMKYDPENVGVLHNISMCYLEEKKYEEADSLLNYLMKVSPGYNDAYILKSQVNLEMGDTAQAYAYADEAVKRDPYESAYWSVRAMIELRREEYSEAESDLTQAIRLGINNANNYINRALARYNLHPSAIYMAMQPRKVFPNQERYPDIGVNDNTPRPISSVPHSALVLRLPPPGLCLPYSTCRYA